MVNPHQLGMAPAGQPHGVHMTAAGADSFAMMQGPLSWPSLPFSIACGQFVMGLLSILKKVKHKEREIRVLLV
jgi:hypothetical protein